MSMTAHKIKATMLPASMAVTQAAHCATTRREVPDLKTNPAVPIHCCAYGATTGSRLHRQTIAKDKGTSPSMLDPVTAIGLVASTDQLAAAAVTIVTNLNTHPAMQCNGSS